jgi:mRNA-degrading endonuclease RelE of RelBE toxin-antitoxin system
MSFEVRTIASFDKQLKVLAKKYTSLKEDYAGLLDRLEQDPFEGASLGNACYKVRWRSPPRGRESLAAQE